MGRRVHRSHSVLAPRKRAERAILGRERMNVSALTLRFDAEQGGFDNTALGAFQQTRDVLSVVEHFFMHDGLPWLLLVLTWKPHRHLEPRRPPSEGEQRLRPADRLTDADKALHEALRAWRNRQAKADGRPPYIILSATELAAVAEARPRTRADLLAIKGVGPGKADRFGEAVLGLVAEHTKVTEAAAPETTADEAADG